MKILLLKDVRKVGQKGQVVEVAEGYGRNFLIKNGWGKLATENVLKSINNQKEQKAQSQAEILAEELKLLGKVNKKVFKINKKASEKGHLFASIHQTEIADLIQVPANKIILEKDIKEVGEFEIKINLGGKKGKIILKVEGE